MNKQRFTSTGMTTSEGSLGISSLYRRIRALIVSPVGLIRGWMLGATTETYRIKDQSGYLKLLVYERKHRGEDVIRIESLYRTRQYEQSIADVE